MDKPVLIIMAAGMGSRYGGLKQMDPVDEYGHMLMDYSVFDAKRAGFERVIIVIKPEMEDLFEEKIGSRLRKYLTVDYAYQVLENLPEGFDITDPSTWIEPEQPGPETDTGTQDDPGIDWDDIFGQDNG